MRHDRSLATWHSLRRETGWAREMCVCVCVCVCDLLVLIHPSPPALDAGGPRLVLASQLAE